MISLCVDSYNIQISTYTLTNNGLQITVYAIKGYFFGLKEVGGRGMLLDRLKTRLLDPKTAKIITLRSMEHVSLNFLNQ